MTLLNPKQASEYLRSKGVARAAVTLRNLRLKGGGPQFRKLGNNVYYEPELLDQWIADQLTAPVRSTSELPDRAAA
jgi:hypothetical protein